MGFSSKEGVRVYINENIYIKIYFHWKTCKDVTIFRGWRGEVGKNKILILIGQRRWDDASHKDQLMGKDCKAYCFLAIHTLSKTYNIHAHSENACLKGHKIKDLFFLTFLHCEAK